MKRKREKRKSVKILFITIAKKLQKLISVLLQLIVVRSKKENIVYFVASNIKIKMMSH